MVNEVVIIGRLTKEPAIFDTKDGGVIAKMSVAVDSGFGEKKQTNYIPVTAFGKTAEFCKNYMDKGRLVAVVGRIQTGSYNKQDGTRVDTFEVVANEIKGLDKAKTPATNGVPSGFSAVNEDVPF